MTSITSSQSLNFGAMGLAIDFTPSLPGVRTGSDADDPDLGLVRRSCAGDKIAYRRLVERHERRVISLVAHVLSSSPDQRVRYSSDIEDLVQEVFVQAWKALPGFRGASRFSTWLYRIAVNRALRERKRAKTVSEHCAPPQSQFESLELSASCDHDPDARDPAMSVFDSVRNERLWMAVDSLPEKQRIVILLRYYDSCSCEEIASIIGCTIGTVWSRLHYGCLRLKQLLPDMEPGAMSDS